MVRLKDFSTYSKFNIYLNLHSNMVRLKDLSAGGLPLNGWNLHSNMVRLKVKHTVAAI